MLPFMFIRYKDRHWTEVDKYIVVIASCHDYVFAQTEWMKDASLPSCRTMRPDIDLREEKHYEFDTEQEMILFVATWYKEHYLDKQPTTATDV